MKKLLMVGLFYTSLYFLCVNAFAQGPHAEHKMGHIPWQKDCSPLDRLDLSADQRDAIKKIETQYKDRILSYRQDLMIKRLELRDLLRDVEVSDDAVRQKSQELETARRLLHGKMIDYQLYIRGILTPEQLRRWCTLINKPSSHGGWKGDSWFR